MRNSVNTLAQPIMNNVALFLALKHAGNLLHSSLDKILARFDKAAIGRCSDHSSCNMLCSRVVGSALQHPVSALVTPARLQPLVS